MSSKDRAIRASILIPLLGLVLAVALLAHEGMEDDSSLTMPPLVDSLKAAQNELFARINVEYQKVKPMLQRSCFDCHSDKTDYPWYHKLPIIKGMLDDHVKEGRRHLNFSNDFPFTGRGNVVKLLERMKEEIEEGEMPLWSYRLMHWGTLIEGEKQDSLFKWIDESLLELQAFYGPDSALLDSSE